MTIKPIQWFLPMHETDSHRLRGPAAAGQAVRGVQGIDESASNGQFPLRRSHETVIFGGRHEDHEQLYSDRREAVLGHWRYVAIAATGHVLVRLAVSILVAILGSIHV